MSGTANPRPCAVGAYAVGAVGGHFGVRLKYADGRVGLPIQVPREEEDRYERGDAVSARAVYRQVLGPDAYQSATEEELAAIRKLIDEAIRKYNSGGEAKTLA